MNEDGISVNLTLQQPVLDISLIGTPSKVTSVAGRTGDVVLVESDITNLAADLGNINTAITNETNRAIAAEATKASKSYSIAMSVALG